MNAPFLRRDTKVWHDRRLGANTHKRIGDELISWIRTVTTHPVYFHVANWVLPFAYRGLVSANLAGLVYRELFTCTENCSRVQSKLFTHRQNVPYRSPQELLTYYVPGAVP